MTAIVKCLFAALLTQAVVFYVEACPAADARACMADVKRHCICESPQAQTSVIVHRDYAGPGLELRERKCLQMRSDTYSKNRQTRAIEIYLTRLDADPGDFWKSHAYKYILIPSK